MIPVQLTLKNFLYRDATLDFSGLHTACIVVPMEPVKLPLEAPGQFG